MVLVSLMIIFMIAVACRIWYEKRHFFSFEKSDQMELLSIEVILKKMVFNTKKSI